MEVNKNGSQVQSFEDLNIDKVKEFIDAFSHSGNDKARFQILMGRDLKELSNRSIMIRYTKEDDTLKSDDKSVYIDYTNPNEFDSVILPTVVSTYASFNETKVEKTEPSLLSDSSTYVQESIQGNKLALFDMPNDLINNSKTIINQVKEDNLVKGNQLVKNNIKPTNYLNGFIDALLLAFITGIFAGIVIAISYYVVITFA